MAGKRDLIDYSTDYVRSPIKRIRTSAARAVESVHTSDDEFVGDTVKGEYELAREKRVAEIQQMFKPVQEAAKAL